MGLNFKETPQSGGGWFKPADHTGDVAILIEVKEFERQRPTPNGPKDSALCDFTYFATQAELDAGKPSATVAGARVEQKALANDLSGLVDAATIVTVVQLAPKNGKPHGAWVWRHVSQTVKDAVIAYAEKREAARAAAVDAAPDFD